MNKPKKKTIKVKKTKANLSAGLKKAVNELSGIVCCIDNRTASKEEDELAARIMVCMMRHHADNLINSLIGATWNK